MKGLRLQLRKKWKWLAVDQYGLAVYTHKPVWDKQHEYWAHKGVNAMEEDVNNILVLLKAKPRSLYKRIGEWEWEKVKEVKKSDD